MFIWLNKAWHACKLVVDALLVILVLFLTKELPHFIENDTVLNPKMVVMMLSPGIPLKIVFSDKKYAEPDIVDVTGFYIKNNNTKFCKNVFMASGTKFPKSFVSNPPARKAVNVTLYHIINTFITPAPYLGNFNLEAAQFNSTRAFYSSFKSMTQIPKNNFRYVKDLQSVILTCCPSLHMYGHFVWDILCPLMLLPTKLVQESTIFLDMSYKSVEICALQTLYGLNESKLVFMKYRTIEMRKWYFTRNLYIFDSQRPPESWQILSARFIKLAKEKYHTQKIKPYRHLLHNREKCFKVRIIKNFNDLVNISKINFLNITWEIESPKLTTFRDIVSYYNTVKFYFTPTGSDVFHVLFMQPKTVVVIAMTMEFNINDVVICHSANVYMVVFLWPKMKGHSTPSQPIPSQLFEKHISIGLQTLQNGRFPSGKSKSYGASKCWK